MFFFEKKNQKTFVPCSFSLTLKLAPSVARGPHPIVTYSFIGVPRLQKGAGRPGFAPPRSSATPVAQRAAPLLSIDRPGAFCPHAPAIDVDLPCCASATGRFKSPGDTVCYEAALPWGGNAESKSQWLAAL
jgi:hypothetical protein